MIYYLRCEKDALKNRKSLQQMVDIHMQDTETWSQSPAL
jgi:hypothetical protein